MPKSASAKESTGAAGPARSARGIAPAAAVTTGLLSIQQSVGNQALNLLLQSGARSGAGTARPAERSREDRGAKRVSPADLLRRAGSEHGGALDSETRGRMEQQLGVNLASVRVHSGAASEAAAESIGARAYTLGSDIYLGSDARSAGGNERSRLLAHEVVHTVQQGGQPVAPQGNMRVSHPGDGAEVEAERIAATVMSAPVPGLSSRSLETCGQFHATPVARPIVSRVATPLIQRDLKFPLAVPEGTFHINMTTISNVQGNSGMSGTISFDADKPAAPDSKNIRLLQVMKIVNLTTGKDHVYTGTEANRNKVMTPSGMPGVQPGFSVDVVHANRTPRTKKTDPEVLPYYTEDNKANAPPNNKDGSKAGNTFTEAKLGDYPHWNVNSSYSFETLAKATDTGHVYGSVEWGFVISDAANGVVDHERAVGRSVSSKSTDVAIDKFNEFYKNPGASTAP